MRRLVQAVGVALVLALSLVPDRLEAAERGFHVQQASMIRVLESASSWLPWLEDTSLDVGQRLEIAVSDPDFVRWLGDLLAVVPPATAMQAIAEIEASETLDDPVLHILLETLKLFPPDMMSEIENADELVFEPKMLEQAMAVLTDPKVPELIGDELQYVAEGVVAMLGAALLAERKPSLARELDQVFVQRAERVPRLIGLLAIWTQQEFELTSHVELITSSDREVLARDQIRAEQSVANLRRLAELEQSRWS
jgi:hypothetical protein